MQQHCAHMEMGAFNGQYLTVAVHLNNHCSFGK
jgi:hypothetical protein